MDQVISTDKAFINELLAIPRKQKKESMLLVNVMGFIRIIARYNHKKAPFTVSYVENLFDEKSKRCKIKFNYYKALPRKNLHVYIEDGLIVEDEV